MHRSERLYRVQDREGFDSGNEPLHIFSRQPARQHSERGILRTFLMVAEDARELRSALGFFTLNICQLRGEELSPELACKETGIFQVAGAERLARFEMGQLPAARCLELAPQIEPASTKDFRRPSDTSRTCAEAQTLLSFGLPSCGAGLRDHSRETLSGQGNLRPHT